MCNTIYPQIVLMSYINGSFYNFRKTLKKIFAISEYLDLIPIEEM
jgi:hypothetical protein